MVENVHLLHCPEVVLGLYQCHSHLLNLLLQELDLVVLQDDDRILLDELLRMLDLLVVREVESPLKFVIQLLDFLIDAQEHFLLAEILDRLHTVRVFLVVSRKLTRVPDELSRLTSAL